MKAYSYLLTVLSVCAVAIGCQREDSIKDQGPAREIAFKAALGKYEVKATDTAFEEGDVVGLFAAAPVSASNVALAWDGQTVKPSEPLFWGIEQAGDEASAFYAYYPYSQGITSTSFKFQVPSDQTGAQAYKSADLLTASALGTPDVGEVYLRFSHQLTRVVFEIDASAMGSAVSSVSLEGLKLDADVDLTVPSVMVSPNAALQTVKAAPLEKADGTKAWGVIVPSQRAAILTLKINLSNGEEVVLGRENLSLEAGVSYTSKVLLDQASVPVSFEFEVFDWIDGGVYNFFGKGYDPGTREHVWGIETYNSGFTQMEQREDGLYYGTLSGNNWYEFRIVREDLGTRWGQAVSSTLYVGEDGVETVLVPNGNYIYAECPEGSVQIILDAVRKVLTLKSLPRQWVSMGMGKMVEAVVGELFGYPHKEIEVEFFKDANSNTYRVVNPYKYWPYVSDFDYNQGGEIIITGKEDGRYYIGYSETGLSYEQYGSIAMFGLVPENGYNNYSYYGYYDERYGYIQFYDPVAIRLSEYGAYMSNREGMLSFILPGYERTIYYYDIQIEMVSQEVDTAGQTWVTISVFTGMDVTGLRYGLYYGKLSREDVYGAGGVYEDVKINGIEVENVPDGWVDISLPVSQTGTYTIVFDEDVLGIPHYYGLFDTHGIVIDGESAPELNISLEVVPDPYFPESNASVNYFFSNPEEMWLIVVEKAYLEADGITDDSIYDYVISNGNQLSKYTYDETTGGTVSYRNLNPNTNYVAAIAGTDGFGQIGWDMIEFRTPAEPAFEKIGNGSFADVWTWGEGSVSVDILGAGDVPSRYRLMYPYAAHWSGFSPGEYFDDSWYYTGEDTSYIDFFIDGDDIHYKDFYNGECYDGYGPIMFRCVDSYGNFLPGNTKITEGVYNLAPHLRLTWTTYYYDLSNYWEQIYIVMPGYDYPPASAGAPSKKSVRSGLNSSPAPEAVLSPVTGERSLKRHMLKGGKSAPRAQEVNRSLEIIK